MRVHQWISFIRGAQKNFKSFQVSKLYFMILCMILFISLMVLSQMLIIDFTYIISIVLYKLIMMVRSKGLIMILGFQILNDE